MDGRVEVPKQGLLTLLGLAQLLEGGQETMPAGTESSYEVFQAAHEGWGCAPLTSV